jgi:hypothetical protein
MAVPLRTKKIVKKRVKQFKRPHSDRYIGLKVCILPFLKSLARPSQDARCAAATREPDAFF